MVINLLPLILINSTHQTMEGTAPFAPICYSASESGAIVSRDILELKENWKSKEWLELKSGNIGQYRNGCYFIVDRKTPLLHLTRQKYLLAKKILELASGEKGRPGFCLASGLDFDAENVKCLGTQIRRWTALSLNESTISKNERLEFAISGIMSFSGNGQAVTIPPRMSFPSQKIQDDFVSDLKKVGNLEESKEEGARSSEGETEASMIGTENIEGRLYIKIFTGYAVLLQS